MANKIKVWVAIVLMVMALLTGYLIGNQEGSPQPGEKREFSCYLDDLKDLSPLTADNDSLTLGVSNDLSVLCEEVRE